MYIYCTYLTVYSASKLPPFYIGSTSLKNISNGYRGSVTSKKYKTLWKDELKNNPHLFQTKIISNHNTRKEATAKELSLQKSLKVVESLMYINMAYATPNGYFGMDNKGIPKTSSMKEKLKGNTNAKSNTKPKSKAHKESISRAHLGKIRNKSHSKAISLAKKGGSWWNKDGATKMSKTSPGDGWTKGRYSSSS